jgi:hypothetical protein
MNGAEIVLRSKPRALLSPKVLDPIVSSQTGSPVRYDMASVNIPAMSFPARQ